ncbi:MAG: nickel pincer cofactor biosynthesis protein LarB [Desulfobacteraceae bacterium]|nr:nickel pincer cofactor biosynthesis protein LarB [Desulfobacteraceae bacterium]
MSQNNIKAILQKLTDDSISINEAETLLKKFYFEDIGYAHIDHHRSIRKGFPEVIFGQGKSSDQIIGIIEKMIDKDNIILATRVNKDKAENIQKKFNSVEYYEDAKLIQLKQKEPDVTGHGEILVISAGTSDIPVAKEAFLTAKAMGNKTKSIYDVGVAGIHRLFAHKDIIENASVIIAVAGMEGALPSVVAGLVKSPVIAVPTSIGYGTSFSGLTALFGMLNSCSSNVSVVNIDNGFGAGYMASAINHTGLSY